jgi:eukaryotic-like serine/threonine-protein kinase
MTPDRWKEIERIYHSALELEESQRVAFLEEACADDQALRHEVESLLGSAESTVTLPRGFWASRRMPRTNRLLEEPALKVAAKESVRAKPRSLVGKQVGSYQILSLLASGGMGVVYKARDSRLKRFAAIKVLPADQMSDPKRRRRFIQEARAASALNHPNIITIHDIGRDADTDFIVMEYVSGKTLGQRIPNKGMRLDETLKIAISMADALAKAHSAGIIHRDLKPTNVMVTDDGLVKVLDFGLAKLTEVESEEGGTRTTQLQTEEGTIVGTISYMSPEQAKGKKVDARSDIFSFGAVLYEMVTGQKAFPGESKMSTLMAVLKQEPKPLSQLVPGTPPDLEKIINRCLRKDAGHRFQHMDDVKVELEELKEESDSGKLRAATALQPARRRSWLWAAGLLALLAISAAVLWFIRSTTRTQQAELTAVPLTSYPGNEDRPTFSPDGSQVAFVWDGEKQDNDDIYIKLIGSGSWLRLTTEPARDYSPAWSPDGRSIAFLRDLPGGRKAVLLVPPIGGPERKVAETLTYRGSYSPSSNLTWSPDGSSLAIVDGNSPNEPLGIFLLSVDTGEKRKLTFPPPEADGDFSPAFSPDGGALAFVRLRAHAAGDLFVQQLSGNLNPEGKPKPILPRNQVAFNPAWTLDGREIIASLGTSYGPSGLWRIAADGSGTRQRLGFIRDESDSPSLSRQKNRLAYARFLVDLNIWQLELTGTRKAVGPPAKFGSSSTRNEANPHFSRDGRKIVFFSDRSGSSEIWVCNRDGSHAFQVTSMGGPPTGTPRWSPDGEDIAFDSSPGGHWDIFVVAASGGKPRRLTNQPSSRAIPSWSRDGKWIYFCTLGSVPQIWKAPAPGGEAVQVTRKGGFAAFESPDGRYLYYTKSERGTEGLWRMPVEGGEEAQVISRVIALRGFAVTDLGIYFLTRSNAEFYIQFLSFATAKTETIAKVEGPTGGALTVSSDGKSILYAQADQLGRDLMLVENFR